MRNHCKLMLATVVFLSPLVYGQQDARDIEAENKNRLTPPSGGGEGSDVIYTVNRENSSRLAPASREPEKITFEYETTTTITSPELQFTPCQASVEIGYHQRNTLARVQGEISHDACAVATGTVDLRVSYYNADDELVTKEFTEAWQLDNAQQMEFSRDYEIGEQALLFRVRSSNLRCRCEDSSETE